MSKWDYYIQFETNCPEKNKDNKILEIDCEHDHPSFVNELVKMGTTQAIDKSPYYIKGELIQYLSLKLFCQ